MTMFAYNDVNALDWTTVQPHVDALLAVALDAANADAWLRQWSALEAVLEEAGAQIYREITENTADADAEQRFTHFIEEIIPQAKHAEQALKQKLLALPDYMPAADAALLLQRFRSEADLFRAENVPVESKLDGLGNQYNKIVGGMTISWQGAQETVAQATSRLQGPDRAEREAVWHGIMQRYLQERSALNDLYLAMLPLRRTVAAQAGFANYRDFRWLQLGRFDYRAEDAFTFHDAIEHEVVPLATQLYQQQAARLGIERLRPWDVDADPQGEPLHPFAQAAALEAGGQHIFDQVDPVLAGYFRAMRDGYLDLASRPNKAPGAYCNGFPVSGKPYIQMNGVGTQTDVFTLLHEGGHAFHFMESQRQPLIWNMNGPMEFCEVASMSMELLSAPYLAQNQGGFHMDAAAARRAYADKLRWIVLFLPYVAVVDAFQHWVYADAPQTVTADDLDAVWTSLWERFLPGIDYRGLTTEKATGWQRKGHIFEAPFYYIEYGLAQLGALQVWRNALTDQAQAVAAYRSALALGYTRPLPELFAAAGARFAFDRQTVGDLMALIKEQLALLKG